jgi:hypothetical protein
LKINLTQCQTLGTEPLILPKTHVGRDPDWSYATRPSLQQFRPCRRCPDSDLVLRYRRISRYAKVALLIMDQRPSLVEYRPLKKGRGSNRRRRRLDASILQPCEARCSCSYCRSNRRWGDPHSAGFVIGSHLQSFPNSNWLLKMRPETNVCRFGKSPPPAQSRARRYSPACPVRIRSSAALHGSGNSACVPTRFRTLHLS